MFFYYSCPDTLSRKVYKKICCLCSELIMWRDAVRGGTTMRVALAIWFILGLLLNLFGYVAADTQQLNGSQLIIAETVWIGGILTFASEAILNLMNRARADEIIRRKAESEHRTHPMVDEGSHPWRGA
jgi:hypothetical protein